MSGLRTRLLYEWKWIGPGAEDFNAEWLKANMDKRTQLPGPEEPVVDALRHSGELA